MNRIIKIGENNVEVTPSKQVTTTDGEIVEIWDEEKTQSYGQDRIDNEKLSYEAQKTSLTNIDPVQDKIDKLAVYQAKLDENVLIQEKMDE